MISLVTLRKGSVGHRWPARTNKLCHRENVMSNRKFLETLVARRMDRRVFGKALAAAGLGLVTIPLVSRRAAAEDQAIYYTWSNYTTPELFPSYVEKYGAPPETPVFGDNEEALQKIRSGFVADVTHPCSSMTRRWREAGILAPIDTSKLSHWGDLFEPLQSLPTTVEDGKHWFVPFDWGQTSITYRTDLVDLQGQEESWGLLWDERYKGKLGTMAAAEDAWWCAAIYAGVDVTQPITMADVEKVHPLLVKQRPLLRFYSTDTTQVEQALAAGEVVAAMTWNESPLSLTKQGLKVKFANPKEGALTWCCGLVLLKEAPNPDKAHDLIDALIDPRAGQYLIEQFGYGHSNQKSFDNVAEADLVARGLSKEPMKILARGKFSAPPDPKIDQAIQRDYEKIQAGF
jgi:spermidine/putrescine transport system substrate-binding protein